MTRNSPRLLARIHLAADSTRRPTITQLGGGVDRFSSSSVNGDTCQMGVDGIMQCAAMQDECTTLLRRSPRVKRHHSRKGSQRLGSVAGVGCCGPAEGEAIGEFESHLKIPKGLRVGIEAEMACPRFGGGTRPLSPQNMT